MPDNAPKLTLPTVHRNGSDAGELKTLYAEASYAIRQAVDKVCDARPNARDYYPQGDGAFKAAVAEHESRIARLRSVRLELDALAQHCDKECP